MGPVSTSPSRHDKKCPLGGTLPQGGTTDREHGRTDARYRRRPWALTAQTHSSFQLCLPPKTEGRPRLGGARGRGACLVYG